MTPTIDRPAALDDVQRTAVLALADDVERVDGSPPLSDQTRAQLGSDAVVHLLARDAGRLIGYAQLDGGNLEVAAEPDAVGELIDAAGARTAWSHGSRSRLVGELERRGFVRSRELYQLRRPFGADHPLPTAPTLPADVTVRTFEPGHDDAAWLAVNAAAFAHHPEQGRLTQTDLDARLAEPWFDAAGFLLAERAGELLGYHWTKIHPDGLGEVYVLGTAPAAQGLGVGRHLLIRGLAHLEDRGCPAVLLYVDGDNPTAVRLYEKAGFDRYDLDVQWHSPE